jgi:hypothetical protein
LAFAWRQVGTAMCADPMNGCVVAQA